MDGTFACPECGTEIVLEGLSPGRQVRCGWCSTSIEVPFLPRKGTPLLRRRSDSRTRRKVILAWTGLGIATFLVVVIGTGRFFQRRDREQHEGALCGHISAAQDFEKAGQFDRSLDEIDQAVAASSAMGPQDRERLESLQRDRARLVRRAAEIRLAAIPADAPDKAVAACLSLRAWVRKETTLSDLEDAVDDRLERSLRQWAENDANDARLAAKARRGTAALDLCERLMKTTEELVDKEARRQLRSDAELVVRDVIIRQGVILDPIRGEFTLGSSQAYDTALHTQVESLLSQRGYVLRRPASDWNRLWDSLAPYHVAISISERMGANYLHSENRLSVIEAKIMLGRAGKLLWTGGPAIARSQSPIPNLAVYKASQIAVGDRRNEAERIIYQDAYSTLIGKFNITINGLPNCPETSANSKGD